MENKGDSENQEFRPDLWLDDTSMKNNGYSSTGNEEFDFLPEDQSVGNNGYSTGNEEFPVPSATWTLEDHYYKEFEAARLGETRLDFDSAVSDQGSIETASGTPLPETRRNGPISEARLRKRETDKAYRRRSKETQEKIKEERDCLKTVNAQLRLEIFGLKCRIQEKDRQMKSSLETNRNEMKEKKQQMDTLAEKLRLELKISELENKAMKAEMKRLGTENRFLQRELAFANQSSQTQSSETARGRHFQ